jgi:hypothetical protein
MENEIVSVEELIQDDSDYTEWFTIKTPRKRGKVKIRPIVDTNEMEKMATVIQKMTLTRNIMPKYAKYSEKQISLAVYISTCVVEPKIGLDHALEMCRTMGPIMQLMMSRIFTISGITETALETEVAELKADPFSVDDPDGVSGIPASPSLGTESDD